ncbi:DUF4239 domain-containing protein [Agromyces aurantiacus]|uniref:DUF4239 domain-containing protein n=1 Tax=Agromyces aurantiacus TaxID=165814 RepID=A0ABV9RAD0_9MICO|nr:DUF4239 domain-containing protein [Agromyces aurantiacus]MBM7503791.1 hypothetical protein [Agromyces aurantiacus]
MSRTADERAAAASGGTVDVNWFYEASVWVTLPLFLIVFVVASCGIVVGLRPVVARLADDRGEWDRALGHVIGTFGVFFGILLALVAVSVYENLAHTRQVAIEEASRVGALYRASSGLPGGDGDRMHEALGDYLRAVIDGDFPAQQRQVLPTASDPQVDEMDALLESVEVGTLGEQAEYKQVLESYDAFIEARRARIDATALALPPMLWAVIWVGAAINAVLIAFIAVRGLRLHLLMAGLLAVFIGLVIFVTADMDHPYAGAISIDAGAFERVLEQVVDESG